MGARLWWSVGALLGGAGVAMGAFGAHALRARLDAERLAWWETGARYLLVHALALLALGAWRRPGDGSRWATAAGLAWALGALIFAGSLAALALTGRRIWGAVTPLGGTTLLIGWALALAAGWRGSRDRP